MTTVIIPLDSSAAAEAAIPVGIAFARRIGATIRLLSVIEVPRELNAWMSGTESDDIDELVAAKTERMAYLQGVADRIANSSVETLVLIGEVPEQIVAACGESNPTVIVMASHGVSGLRRNLVGTVTTRVVHGARCPVIVVRAGQHLNKVPRFNRLLIALDGSRPAERAMETAISLLGTEEMHLHLLRVIETAYWFSIDFDGVGYYDRLDAYLEAMHDDVTAYLESVAERVRSVGCSVSWEMCDGLVDMQIETVAYAQSPDLIVMATHGRTGLGRVLIGSVAERVLRDSQTPVMLVRPIEE